MKIMKRIIFLPVMLVLQVCLILLFAGHCFYSVCKWLVSND